MPYMLPGSSVLYATSSHGWSWRLQTYDNHAYIDWGMHASTTKEVVKAIASELLVYLSLLLQFASVLLIVCWPDTS